jgi:hypothetical protein
LITPAYPFLDFEPCAELPVDRGVPDDLWRSQEPAERGGLFDQGDADQ